MSFPIFLVFIYMQNVKNGGEINKISFLASLELKKTMPATLISFTFVDLVIIKILSLISEWYFAFIIFHT